MLCGYSSLSEDKIAAIQKLESEIGHSVLALSCSTLGSADLSEDELVKLKDLEEKLGLVLIAV